MADRLGRNRHVQWLDTPLRGERPSRLSTVWADLKLLTEDAAKAVAEKTGCLAMYCQDNANTSVDVS
jgi:hypothetical protein